METKGDDNTFLPLDIIINILKRLPVKSILRFQCVCEQWKTLFKTKTFIAEHFHHHHSDHKNPFLLLYQINYNDESESLRLLNQNMETFEVLSMPMNNGFQHGWKIIGSCNGLLFVVTNLYSNVSPQFLCLWNPIIREVYEIPQTMNDYWEACIFGFGFCSVVNDYKIVRFYNQEIRKKVEKDDQHHHMDSLLHDGVEVYSVSTGLWKELEFPALKGIKVRQTSVSSDGIIVWLGRKDSIYALISFDIVTEAFTISSIPHVPEVYPVHLGVLGDKFVVFWCAESYYTDIMVMEQVAIESGKSLCRNDEYRVCTFSYATWPLCVWRDVMVFSSGVESDVEVEEGEDKADLFISLFNLNDKTWEEFNDFSSPLDCHAGFNYETSLVSVSI